MLWHTWRKDLALLRTDLHGLVVMLLMPALFMLVMSYALSGDQPPSWQRAPLTVEASATDEASRLLSAYLNDDSDPALAPVASVTLTAGFGRSLNQRSGEPPLTLQLPAGLAAQAEPLLLARLEQALARTRLHLYLRSRGELPAGLDEAGERRLVQARTDARPLIRVESGERQPRADAMVQSVPAWLVFGMFFIVLPLTHSLLAERHNGTLLRLRTFPLSSGRLLLAKGLSYGLINLLQGGLLLAIGLLLVPALLGRSLTPANPLWQVIPLLLATAAAAVALGLLVAVLIRSADQAVVAAGGCMLVLAAVSGIMVPLEIMPQGLMQQLALVSPMYWASSALRSWLLTPQPLAALWPALAMLLAWALLCAALAITIFSYRMRTLSWTR